jgi:hypothetical protein
MRCSLAPTFIQPAQVPCWVASLLVWTHVSDPHESYPQERGASGELKCKQANKPAMQPCPLTVATSILAADSLGISHTKFSRPSPAQ